MKKRPVLPAWAYRFRTGGCVRHFTVSLRHDICDGTGFSSDTKHLTFNTFLFTYILSTLPRFWLLYVARMSHNLGAPEARGRYA